MKQNAMLSVALVALLASSTVANAKQRSDHALLHSPGGDTSVQCWSKRRNGPASFVYFVTMTNAGRPASFGSRTRIMTS